MRTQIPNGNDITVALYGIYGTYNFGCEAIVRGAQKFIRSIFPDAKIVYYSYSYDYDKTSLSDLEIEIRPIIQKRSLSKRVINKLCSILGTEHRLFFFDIKKILEDVDIVLSIGGDIYTIPAVLRENAKYPYYNHLIDFCDIAISLGKQVVVYGASVGPWGDYLRAVNYYKNNMQKYRMILCRDKNSVDYLQSLGFSNVMFFPDPAFLLRANREDIKKEDKYIGINLSPLSLNELYGDHDEAHMIKIAGIIDSLYQRVKYPLIFLPHVLSNDENDNDLIFMQQVKNKMKYGDLALIADSNNGFLGLKDQIRKCHIVISARMHCAINALEDNIPTIFLSYSQKSIGMCEYIYGCREWVIGLNEVEERLLDTVESIIEQHDSIVEFLCIRNKEIETDYNSGIKEVIKRLC
mgnify:CR=1 FL=1